MARHLFIHVGPAKTGTSALQKQLREKTPPDLLYPACGQWHDGAHHRLILSFSGRESFNGEPILPAAEMKKMLFDEVAESDKDVLISSEAIGNLKLILEQMGGWLDDTFSKISVIYTSRHPISRAASSYNQAVKDPHVNMTLGPDDYLREKRALCLLANPVKLFASYGFPLLVVPYAPATSFVSRFLSTIGHDMPVTNNIAVNRSMSGAALVTMLCINRLFSDMESRKVIFKQLTDEEPVRVWQGSSFPFNRKTLSWYEEECLTDDREKLAVQGLAYPQAKLSEAFELTQHEERNIRAFLAREIIRYQDKITREKPAEQLINETLALFTDAK